ncbi:MAG: hypothetical protein M3094_05305 [Actinomycetia bacterium]|nr:hypothetical protein [Actinomycetes bacterium]
MRDTRINITRGNQLVTATYGGGAYIDLGFGGMYPVECINVWDDETGRPEIEKTVKDVRRTVKEWMKTQDKEWPEWYDGYIENSRF